MLLEESTPLLVEDVSTKSQAKLRQEAADLTEARMINSAQPTDFSQLYNQAKAELAEAGFPELMQREQQAYAAKEKTDMLGAVAAGMPVEDSIEVLKTSQIVEDIYSDVDGKEQMRNNALPKDRDIDELQEAQNMVKQYAYSIVGEMMEEDGFFDWAMNIGGLLAPDETKDFYETFGSVERFNAMAEAFRLMSPEEQMEVLPALLSKVREGYDENPLDVAYILDELFGGGGIGGNVGFNAAMDALSVFDIGGLIRISGAPSVAAKAYKNLQAQRALRSANSKAIQADELGAIEAAAQRQVAAGMNDEVAEAVGTTKMDVARTADPHITKGMDDGTSLDNIAASVDAIMSAKTRKFPEELLLGTITRIPSAPFKLAANPIGDVVSAAAKSDVVFTATARSKQQQVARWMLVEESKLRAGDVSKIQDAFDEAVLRELAAQRVLSKPAADASAALPQAQKVEAQMAEAVESADTPVIYTEDEVFNAMERTWNTLRKELDETGQALTTITPIKADETGVTYQLSTLNGVHNRTMRYTRDDVNTIAENTDPKVWSRWRTRFSQGVFSPDFLLRPLDKHLVDSVTYAGQQTAKLKNELAKIWKDTETGLSKKEIEQVNAVLQVGDERAVEAFPIAELRSGIETKLGTFKFSEQQINSYLQKRAFFRKLHSIKDNALRKDLEFMGHRTLITTEKNADGSFSAVPEFAKPFDSISSGLAHVDDKVVWANGEARNVKGVAQEATKLEEQGYKLVEFNVPKIIDDIPVKYGLVGPDVKWSDLPKRVLHYQEGYVPRIYRPGYVFVRDMQKRGLGVRAVFETMEDAKKFIADAKEKDPTSVLSPFRDKEFKRSERLLQEADSFGGFITGARKSTLPVVMKDGAEHALERMSVGQATDRYLHNVSATVPLNEYRAATIARWEDDVNALLKASNRDLGKKINFNTPDNMIDLPPEVKDVLIAQRNYVKEHMGMKLREESVFEDFLLRTANAMEGKPFLAGVRNNTLWNLDKHPNDALKAANFNLMLGMFNLRQIFVQMQNASLAMSMYPKYAPAAIKDALAARAYLATKNTKAREALLARFDKDTVELVKQFDESGLVDSIVRQADLNNQTLGVHHTSLDKVRTFVEKGRIPFNEGEIMARALAFSIAKRKLRDEGKELTTKLVNEETLRLNMNLQNENSAWWQNAPVINLATQFLQVQAKFVENLMPTMLGGSGRWTAKEKRRVLVGQLALYGTVGVPVVHEALSYLASLAGYDTTEEFISENPTVAETVNEGFVGMVSTMLGTENAEFTSSFSLLAGLDDNLVYDVFKSMSQLMNGGYTDQGFLETLTGPSAASVRRFGNAVDSLLMTGKLLTARPTIEEAKGAIIKNIDDIAQLTSTWSNARKVLLLQEVGLVTSSGKKIADIDELAPLNLQTQLAMAMGFKHDVESLSYLNAEVIQKTKNELKQIKQDYREQIISFSLHNNEEMFLASTAILFAGLSKKEAEKIQDEVFDETFTRDSKAAKEMKVAIDLILNSMGERDLTAAQSTLMNKMR